MVFAIPLAWLQLQQDKLRLAVALLGVGDLAEVLDPVGVEAVLRDAVGVDVVDPLAGALLALDRSRTLGHALLGGRLVAQSGSLTCRRDVLGVEHVIGWNLQDSWFQRRAGLTTLVATTAGGGQRVVVPDVPEDVAVAAAATPDLLAQFRG